jgi:hypothetical protein
MTRTHWTDLVCTRLSAAIASETPAGLGAWEPAWEMVAEPSAALLAELDRYEREGGDRQATRQLGLDVLAGWRRAAMRWRANAA